MITERIDALNINDRGLFTAIYGVNMTPEVYVTRDLRKLSFYEAIYLYLRQEGYITVFYDNQVWSYEEEMLAEFLLLNPPQGKTDGKVLAAGGRRDFFAGKGPMHKSRAKAATQTVNDTPIAHHPSVRLVENGLSRYYTVLQDVGFFGTIYSVTERFPQRRVAVIFVNPDTLEYNEDEQKTYQNNLARLQTEYKTKEVGLKLIALYNHGWAKGFMDEVKEDYKNKFLYRSPFKELILEDFKFLMNNDGDVESCPLKTTFFVTDPQRDEINNVMNRLRIEKGGLPDAFSNIPWDTIILRLWQSGLPDRNTKKGDKVKSLRAVKDFLDYPIDELNLFIKRMDTMKAIDRLNALQGIDNIKQQFERYRLALKAHHNGSGGGRFRPHMALMGSPGTGKSTVARLFGDILREDGLLPKGHFVKVDVSEIIGEYVGSTRPKTRAVCERARGGVLFIDEAYGLMSGDNDHGDVNYGQEAIEVLIQFMEDNDDSLVILAGYTDEIMHLINEGNKGFRRRFNNLGFFYFHDYKPDVLFNISMKMINVPTTEAFRTALKNIIKFKYAYRTKKFGNVGDMENLVNNIVGTYRNSGDTQPLDVRHLPDKLRMLIDPNMLDEKVVFKELNNLVGQEGVKTVVRELFNNCWSERDKMMRHDDFEPEMPDLVFVFSGNPGTGKTTIARIMGEVLQKLGVLQSEDANVMTEIKGNDLLTATSEHLNKLFEDNIGKVLFIDEAYMLTQSPRVLADIVANITSKDYENKLCIIMAGYTADMQRLIDVNAGMDRRLQVILFTDYTNEELFEILARLAENPKTHVRMDRDICREPAVRYFASLVRDRKFGNAGTAVKLMKYLKKRLNERYRKATEEQRTDKDFALRILPEDFPVIPADNISQSQGVSPTKTKINDIGMQYDGVLDLSGDDQDKCVKEGVDLYASVGLLDTGDGTGTAFVISLKNRYILTANHVVEGASQFKFTLNMQNSIMLSYAHLLWNSPMHDLAILQVDSLPDGAKFFAFDNTTERSPGVQIQIAAFPLGTQVSNTMLLTQGNIANYQGECEMSSSGRSRKFDAIRTDAQATHGSSGGPVMLKDNWKVIGVLHGGMSEGGFSVNVVTDSRQLFNDNSLKIKVI